MLCSEVTCSGEAADVRPAPLRACAACNGRAVPLSGRGVCVSCLTKIAQFDSIQILMDDAMVGSERMAVIFPLAPLPVGPTLEPAVEAHFDLMRALWASFPRYEGDLADVDHLGPDELLPEGDDADAYRALLPQRWSEYRLIPRHLASGLGLMDFGFFQLLRQIGRSISDSSGERRAA